MPDWLPEWLHPWLERSQGISICGVEWLMLAEMLLLMPIVLMILREWDSDAA